MNKPRMREISESGFTVRVPSQTSFRFSECPSYLSLSGMNLKEMDFGWWDSSNCRITLMELKGDDLWLAFDNSRDTAHKHLVDVLIGKATDSLFMLAATWIGTSIGMQFRDSLPPQVHGYPGEGNLKVIFLIDTPPSRKPLLAPVKDAINSALGGRMRLFGVRNVTLIDFEVAKRMGLAVTRV